MQISALPYALICISLRTYLRYHSKAMTPLSPVFSTFYMVYYKYVT